MTVADLGERMTAEEFMGWYEFDAEFISDDWHTAAMISSTVANVFGGKTRGSDFLPDRRAAVDPPSPERFKARFGSFRESHNARVRAKGDA